MGLLFVFPPQRGAGNLLCSRYAWGVRRSTGMSCLAQLRYGARGGGWYTLRARPSEGTASHEDTFCAARRNGTSRPCALPFQRCGVSTATDATAALSPPANPLHRGDDDYGITNNSLAQRAVLYEEEPGNPQGRRATGSVVWSIEPETENTPQTHLKR
jgi:hypothetical protein